MSRTDPATRRYALTLAAALTFFTGLGLASGQYLPEHPLAAVGVIVSLTGLATTPFIVPRDTTEENPDA